ncbi:MAG: UvrB/UvrC motif-containing protein [Syntrophaceticus sp.]|jgi:protein arginine kinase activator
MLCQECQRRPATVHLTQIVNNQKKELHLCHECAQNHQELSMSMHFEPSFSIHKFLAGMLDGSPIHQMGASPECPQCGLNFAKFGEIGRFGCSKCYNTFSDRLKPLLRRVQGTTQHTGKVPKRAAGKLGVKREVEKLKAKLQQAVQDEAYEKAAELRDEIRDLESKLQ